MVRSSKNNPREPRKYRKHKRYGGGVIEPTPNGTFRAIIVRDKDRRRKVCKTEGEARAWIDATVAELEQQSRPLSVWEIREAREARDLLPENVSLVDAARCWLASHERPSITYGEAVDKIIHDREDRNLRGKSIISLKSNIKAGLKDFEKRQVSSITTGDLLAHLARWKGVTRDNHRRALHTLFEWCRGRGYIEHNPTAPIEPMLSDQRIPGILTPRQSWRLLHAAERLHPELVPYLAIGLFAGVRPEELQGLRWSSIVLDRRMIHIGPEIAKLRQQRFITISPTLAAWLQAYPQPKPRPTPESNTKLPTGNPHFNAARQAHEFVTPYWNKKLYKLIRECRAAAGIEHWPPDAVRHSFASYHLAVFKDAALTAHEMGDSAAILFKHYRQLVTEDQGRRFFKIMPGKRPEKRKS